jgi:DNA-binding PadR family transcriptional regulator
MPTAADLTTTSYAILGLLAIKPWSTYELARQMDRALGRFWPRTRSKLYEEPKKLVAHGLARASTETVGRRRRTVYSITPQGRRALATWIPTPGAGPVLEFEQLVKVFFAEHGTKQDLLTTLERVRVSVEEQAAETHAIPHDYLERRGEFPQRLPWLLLTGRLLVDFQMAVDRWAEWAIGVVQSWPDDLREAEPDWPTLQALADFVDSYTARRAARPMGSPEHQDVVDDTGGDRAM